MFILFIYLFIYLSIFIYRMQFCIGIKEICISDKSTAQSFCNFKNYFPRRFWLWQWFSGQSISIVRDDYAIDLTGVGCSAYCTALLVLPEMDSGKIQLLEVKLWGHIRRCPIAVIEINWFISSKVLVALLEPHTQPIDKVAPWKRQLYNNVRSEQVMIKQST